MRNLKESIDAAGGASAVAKACGISERAVYKWLSSCSLPRTEYTGETHYADLISQLAKVRGEQVDPVALRANASPKKTAA